MHSLLGISAPDWHMVNQIPVYKSLFSHSGAEWLDMRSLLSLTGPTGVR